MLFTSSMANASGHPDAGNFNLQVTALTELAPESQPRQHQWRMGMSDRDKNFWWRQKTTQRRNSMPKFKLKSLIRSKIYNFSTPIRLPPRQLKTPHPLDTNMKPSFTALCWSVFTFCADLVDHVPLPSNLQDPGSNETHCCSDIWETCKDDQSIVFAITEGKNLPRNR